MAIVLLVYTNKRKKDPQLFKIAKGQIVEETGASLDEIFLAKVGVLATVFEEE